MQSGTQVVSQVAWITGIFALFGALIGSLVSGFFALRSKREEYVHDFFKIVIRKRVEAYEHLESVIQAFKTALVDNDNQPYHQPFDTEKQYIDCVIRVGNAMNSGLWLSDTAFDAVQEINYLQFGVPMDDKERRIRFGKEHYAELANMREALEKQLTADMMELHKVREFLIEKKKHSRRLKPIKLPRNE
jgi:hypothetical protein